ncbi:hypothetical protein HNP84_002632 [Thermocatellispora tengchongensis]|uniref:Uncharacterized protein n=1 Tax=Thermocatellispora tengchongensis TaxID=1073253 RepID=A0A840P4X3_9ACTN|nr:hypothetical protein [Thermocatellispora tengchongensis]
MRVGARHLPFPGSGHTVDAPERLNAVLAGFWDEAEGAAQGPGVMKPDS